MKGKGQVVSVFVVCKQLHGIEVLHWYEMEYVLAVWIEDWKQWCPGIV